MFSESINQSKLYFVRVIPSGSSGLKKKTNDCQIIIIDKYYKISMKLYNVNENYLNNTYNNK